MADFNVSFGGDVSQLNNALAQGKASVASFGTAVEPLRASLDRLNASFGQSREASRQAGSGWRDNLAALADIVIVARAARDALGEMIEVEAQSTGQILAVEIAAHQAALRGLGVAYGVVESAARDSVRATIDQSNAFLAYFASAANAERSARLFAQANEGMRASIGQSILSIQLFSERMRLAFSDLPATQVAAIAAAGGLDRFIAAAERTGGIGAMKETLVGFTAELMRIPGITQEAAGRIEVMLATIPNYSTQTNDILVNLIQSLSKTGDEAVANARRITDAFSDDKQGGKILGDLTGQLKDLEDVQVLATQVARALEPDQASAYFATLIAGLRKQREEKLALAIQDDEALRKTPLIGQALADIYQLTSGAAEKQKEFAVAVDIATANLQKQKAAFDAINAAQQREIDYQKILNDETTRSSRLTEAEGNIATLKSRLPRNVTPPSGAEADLLARTLIGEAGNQGDAGMQAVLNVIKNRVASNYGGAESFADVVTAPRQFSVWNPGDKAGAMANEVSTESDVYKRAMALVQQMTAGTLEDNTSGATSYYNPKDANPAWGASMTNKTQIGSHLFGNTPQSPPLADADEQEKVNQRLQEQYDTIRQINVAKAGGTAADLANLDIAQKNLTTAQDAVADAQKLVEAKKADLAATKDGSPTAVLAAQRALADAEQDLRAKSVAAEKAASDLKADAYRQGSQERMQILNAELTREQAGYAAGSARWSELERQKQANLRQYQDAERTASVDAENARFDALKRGFAEESELIKARGQMAGQMRAEDYADLADVLARQAEAERAHYQALQRLYADQPREYSKYAQQITQVDAREHQLMLQNSIAFQQQIVATYRSAFEQVGSTISSTLMQMIQRQATLRDLLRNVALNIIQQFIEARIKVVADWAAGQAATVAATVTAESAKTGATAAGTAARSDLIGAASVVQMAQVGFGVIKSIVASAAEAFAGIFGFLSPVMGPAAAVPAAAGQATVLGAASLVKFDVGSWSLPRDQLALVHAGEMIVPAAQTPWMQSLATAAAGGLFAGGAGQRSGDVHLHVNAVDAHSFVGMFKTHKRELMKIFQAPR